MLRCVLFPSGLLPFKAFRVALFLGDAQPIKLSLSTLISDVSLAKARE